MDVSHRRVHETITFTGEKVASAVGPLPKETMDLYKTPQGYKVVYHEDGANVIYPGSNTDHTEEEIAGEFPELWNEYK